MQRNWYNLTVKCVGRTSVYNCKRAWNKSNWSRSASTPPIKNACSRKPNCAWKRRSGVSRVIVVVVVVARVSATAEVRALAPTRPTTASTPSTVRSTSPRWRPKSTCLPRGRPKSLRALPALRLKNLCRKLSLSTSSYSRLSICSCTV